MTTLLRLATAGSVDDGKSTLIGRLLYDSKAVMEDQWASVEQTSKDRGHDYTDLALVTDGLRAEREQGITIDVAYRYFATPKRKFIIADTPGHIQYTRNMVTGASTAQLVIVLVDARHGLLEQSRRHAFLASLLGIRHLVLAVNKMDLLGWDQEKFDAIRDEFHAFAARLDVQDVTSIPISALHGDNVVTKSDQTPWYEGPSLLSHLEDVYIAGDRNMVDVRFPVQYVIRPHTLEHQDHRSYAGTVASGVMRSGDEVVVLPIGKTTRITAIDGPNGPVAEAFPPMAVSVRLADDIDISRGDMIARTHNQPRITQEFDATVCWMADNAVLEPGRDYVVKHTTRTVRARIAGLDYRLDVNTLHRDKTATALKLNELGRVSLRTQVRCCLTSTPATLAPARSSSLTPTPTERWRRAWCYATSRPARLARTRCGTDRSSLRKIGRPGARRCGLPDCPAPASRRWPCWLSGSYSKRASPLTFWTATTYGMASTPTWAFPWPTARRTCAGCRMWPHCSPIVATWCWCRRSAPLLSTVPWLVKCTLMRESTFSRCSVTPRCRTVRGVIPKGCTPKRVRVRSRTSPGSTAHISGPRTQTYGLRRIAA